MKSVYCSSCGKLLSITRRALPKYGRIIELVEWHECLHEPIALDLIPNPVPSYVESKHSKFVQYLNELQPPPALGTLSSGDFRDRRHAENVKSEIDSTAPVGILNKFKSTQGLDND